MRTYLEDARLYCHEFGWQEIDHQPNIKMVSFRRETARINVYYSKATVATVVDHPRWGRNQMFRRDVPTDQLRLIFEYPRIHLNQHGTPGYHQNGRHISKLKRRHHR